MVSSELVPLITVLVALYLLVIIFSYLAVRRIRRGLEERDRDVKRRLYELAILKEISDRTGYSLNIQKILDVIVGSLNQFIEYSAVSYMLLDPSKVVFKVDLRQSVSNNFIRDIRRRMLDSLSALLGRDISDMKVEETIEGAIMIDATEEPVRSYFNIPFVIGGELAGVLTVSNTKAGLYKESEMEILYKIVNQASQAVTKLEGVIKNEQGKIAAMLESMLEGVIMTDREYHVIAANPAAKLIIGHKEDSTPTIFDFMGSFKDILDIKGKLEEAIKLDKTLTEPDVLFRNKYYQIVISPVKSNVGLNKGQILGGVVIFHDITHEKEAENMRNEFTSLMVHELRSPLGNIKKIGEVMRSTKILEDKEASSEYVSMLYESSSSMLDLVNDLLDVARLEAGKLVVDKKQNDIKEVLADRVKFFETEARNAGVNLKLSVIENIPNNIEFDYERIKQVLNNLFSNSLKYTSSGGLVTISCFIHKSGESFAEEAKKINAPWVSENMTSDTTDVPSCVVAVTDTGEGITGENIEKLFNKFTQFASSIRKDEEHKGTGLGLVIVKGIVEAHGGVVGVGSKPGVGSTFYFTLPL